MTRPNPEYIKQLLERVKNSPFPKHIGMRLTAIDLDISEVSLEIAEYHMQPYGIVHGGGACDPD